MIYPRLVNSHVDLRSLGGRRVRYDVGRTVRLTPDSRHHRAGSAQMIECNESSLPLGPLHKRDVVVFADALQHEEGSRAIAAVGDEVRATRADGVRLTRPEPDLLLGLT